MFGFNNVQFIGPIMCGAFAVGMLYMMAEAVYHLYVIFTGPLPQSEKRAFESVAMLPEMQDMDLKLQLQGFKPLAVLRVKTKFNDDAQPEWLYANEEGTIWVETIQLSPDAPPMAQYSSLFKDKAMIITRFPQGEAIATDNYHSRFAAQDVDAAYQYHLKKVKEWAAKRGKPRLVTSAEDVKTYDTIWHQTHRATDYGKLVWVNSVKALIALIAALLMAYSGWLLWRQGLKNAEVVGVTFVAGLVLSSAAPQVPVLIQKFRFRKANAVDSRKEKSKSLSTN